MPYRTHVTGQGVQPMDLEFTDIPQYQRWIRHVTDIRSGATAILALRFQEAKIIYLHCTWIPNVEQLVHEWGNDFVPSDITANLENARQFLDQSPPLNPALLRILRETLTEELHGALRRENEER